MKRNDSLSYNDWVIVDGVLGRVKTIIRTNKALVDFGNLGIKECFRKNIQKIDISNFNLISL